MSILTKADDPRFLTIVVAALFSAALWLATWSVMGSMDMGSMSGMKMDGMSMEMGDKPMAMDGETMEMGDKPMTMGDGAMSGDGAKPEGGMAMDGETMQMGDEPMAMDGMKMEMDMFGMSMDPTDWSARTIAETSVMWLLMMAAMMLPAMAPVMAVYAGVSAKEDSGARLALRITLFTLSYFLLWAAFSVTAAIGQLAFRGSDLFMMGGTHATPILGGIMMIVAGGYQFTKLKHVCLAHCRHPLQYLLQHWKPGLAGAFPVGARHGLYCFGCCIAFMGLMFTFGAMNVWYMAAIAAYFLAEKILPAAERWGMIAGALLIAGGAAMIASNL
ncbi:MAG: DUF2182 domain-containing protein [Pseudomonadota bacterium]